MRGAALLLQKFGATVSGSDANGFPELGDLVAAGAVVHVGHDASYLPERTDLVVASAAVPDHNPELQAAQARGIRTIRYAELVGWLMRSRAGVSVSGTHGKSTTTALTAYMYRLGGLDPSFIVGASSRQLGGSAGAGQGPHFVVESCEYARSFLHLYPRFAAILNIEPEHLDCYADLDEIVATFGEFAGHVPLDGVVIARHGDVAVGRAVSAVSCRVETFGLEDGATWQATQLTTRRDESTFVVRREGRDLFPARIKLAGVHNVSNALAATALAWNGGVPAEAIARAIADFEGVERRMTLRGVRGGVTVIDDYAHHPTEIAVTLRAIRIRYEPRRTIVVFQPHQHSRTRLLMDDFAGCFAEADVVVIPDIYAVRDSEEERHRTGSRDLVARIHAGGRDARYIPRLDDVARELAGEVSDGDVVVTMGAGDVWKVADALVEPTRRAG